MNDLLERPAISRLLAGVLAFMLATIFNRWLDMSGLILDPDMARRMTIAFLLWCEATVVIPEPPNGMEIVISAAALLSLSGASAGLIEATVRYVLSGPTSDLPYTLRFMVIAMPAFVVSAVISQFTDKGRKKTGWLSWIVQDSRFVFIGTACSVLGLVLTVWPWRDIVQWVAGR